MEWLTVAVSMIVLVASVLTAVKTITDWIGKPINSFSKKYKKNFNDNVTAIVLREVPKLLEEHDVKTHEKYLADRKKYLQDIREDVLINMQDELKQIALLREQYEPLVISAKDVLREKIMCIYHKHCYEKKMSTHESEALAQYYKDYKAMRGNSYIDKYYSRMAQWTVEEDDYDERTAL